YNNRTLAFAKSYTESLLAIDVQMDMEEMLDKAWELVGKFFQPEETGIKQAMVEKYWKD
ncbi:MAG TPA: V-type ATP synthase subunit B, partial [Bacteroidetes bacterium]|nr:V-type ATP synthase subunit B [Bacteroidota bacterium]